MAAFGALCTSPSASLSATLSYSNLHAQYPLYPISPTIKSEGELRPDVNDDSSFSDKENCPSHTPQKLNRASNTSPVMASLFQTAPSTEHISFTPRRVRPPPRAWERRPATPYVSRNEGQKIWKRIPLQELGIEVNQQVPRRDEEEKKNYLRVIKRLRLDNVEDANVQDECHQVANAMGTKWIEDFIEKDGSPKKKSRNRVQTCPTVPRSHESEMELTFGDLSNVDVNENIPGNIEQNKNELYTSMIEKKVTDSHKLEFEHSVEVTARQEFDKQTDANPDEVTIVASIIGIASVRKGNETMDDTNTMSCETKSPGNGKQCEHMTEEAVLQDTEPALDSAETLSTNNKEVHADLEDGTASIKETSPPGSLLGSNTSDSVTALPCDSSLIAGATALPVAACITSAFPASDHDETAFLREFLERAQASKATKTAMSPQKKIPTAPAPSSQRVHYDEEMVQHDEMEAIDDIEDDDLSPPIESTQAEQTLLTVSNNVTSPTRRSMRTSTRATSSRLPRFQNPSASILPSQPFSPLPAAIQLKRATGSEFIFNAKLQQNLAMLTRSNTKRNQGDAIYVAQRLAQLSKELEVQQQKELAPEAAGSQDAQHTKEEMIKDNGTEYGTTRKRKRDKQDEAKSLKVGKTVKWPSEEDLVKYREPTPFVDCLETYDISEPNVSTALHLEDVESIDVANAVTLAESNPSNKLITKAKIGNPAEDSSKLKVRRIRKIKLDSVNGTPAPKTRSRSVTNSEAVEQNGGTTLHMAPTLSSNIRKSSRMPVPVSTSIPLPGLATLKSKVRSTEKDKDKDKNKENSSVSSSALSSISKPSVETITAVIGNKPDEKSVDSKATPDPKLDGRRRLRGRN